MPGYSQLFKGLWVGVSQRYLGARDAGRDSI
jgi:hypothetical protein